MRLVLLVTACLIECACVVWLLLLFWFSAPVLSIVSVLVSALAVAVGALNVWRTT